MSLLWCDATCAKPFECCNTHIASKTSQKTKQIASTMHKNAYGESIDAKQWLTDLAASRLQTTGRQLIRMMSGGEKDKQGQFGSNATEFGAELGLPRRTGDGADDRTSNDARGRGATGRAGYSIARRERTVRGGWSWCWCWWRWSTRCIVNHLKRHV